MWLTISRQTVHQEERFPKSRTRRKCPAEDQRVARLTDRQVGREGAAEVQRVATVFSLLRAGLADHTIKLNRRIEVASISS